MTYWVTREEAARIKEAARRGGDCPLCPPVINEKRKPNDLLWEVSARRMSKPVSVRLWAQTKEAARCQAAAHLQLDIGEEAKAKTTRIEA